jgi:hypothetical protein
MGSQHSKGHRSALDWYRCTCRDFIIFLRMKKVDIPKVGYQGGALISVKFFVARDPSALPIKNFRRVDHDATTRLEASNGLSASLRRGPDGRTHIYSSQREGAAHSMCKEGVHEKF